MKMPPITRNPAGFTLIEMLVATAISLLLLTVILSLAQSGMSTNERLMGSAIRDGDALFVLNSIARDLEALMIPRKMNTEVLVANSETISGAPSTRLALLSAATDRDPDSHTGGERAVAYRMANQNPITGGSVSPVFALYRAILSVKETFDGPLVDGTSVFDFWDAQSPLVTDPQNFLVGNVVAFELSFLRADNGQWVKIDTNHGIRITGAGVFLVTNPGNVATEVLGGVVAAQISLSFVKPAGAKLLTNGTITLAQANERFGRTVVRQVLILQASSF